MIQTKRKFLELAAAMDMPVVEVDVSKGSRQAVFTVFCFSSGGRAFELPRSLFNGLRDQGILYEDPDNPLKVGDHRAFRVNLENENDASQEEVRSLGA